MISRHPAMMIEEIINIYLWENWNIGHALSVMFITCGVERCIAS